MIKGKIPKQSVLFQGDMYNAVLALPCSTLGHLSGYKSEILHREVSDEETIFQVEI